MSVSVVAAFACAIAAAAGTGVLVGRCMRMPRMDIIAWACVLAALAVALGAQAVGADRGYGSATFRAVQFGAQLIAPLWLAWGLAELAAKSVPVRFAAKLVTMALTVVTGVVLVTDPLGDTPFSKSCPVASKHYQIIPKSLLSLVAVVTLVVVVIALAASLLRLRNDPAWWRPVIAVTAAGVGAALILGLRLTLPSNPAYLALCTACVALAWFAGVWAARVDLAELHGDVPYDRADRRSRPVPSVPGDAAGDEAFDPGYPQQEAFGSGYPRSGENGGHRRYAADEWFRPAGSIRRTAGIPGGGIPAQPGKRGQWPAPGGSRRVRAGQRRPARERPRGTGERADRHRPDRDMAAADTRRRRRARRCGRSERSGRNRRTRRRGRGERAGRCGPGIRRIGRPGRGHGGRGRRHRGRRCRRDHRARAAVSAAGDPAAAQRLYGLIAIYTLAEGATEEFDALAERVVDEVRASEPDALVYAVHSVPNAPMQRIFYEVYRDRMAYEEHKRQPHIQRFEADRSPYVLATNVIELGMQQAKLSSLPGLSQLFGNSPGG